MLYSSFLLLLANVGVINTFQENHWCHFFNKTRPFQYYLNIKAEMGNNNMALAGITQES